MRRGGSTGKSGVEAWRRTDSVGGREHRGSAHFVILCSLPQPGRSIQVKLALAGRQSGHSGEQEVLLMGRCRTSFSKRGESGRTCGPIKRSWSKLWRHISAALLLFPPREAERWNARRRDPTTFSIPTIHQRRAGHLKTPPPPTEAETNCCTSEKDRERPGSS